MRIVVATKNPIERKNISKILLNTFDDIIIDECDNSNDAQPLLNGSDCLIAGYEVCGQVVDVIRSKFPSLPIVIVLSRGDEVHLSEVLEKGADMYIFRLGDYYKVIPSIVLSAIRKRNLEEIIRKFGKKLEFSEKLYSTLTECVPDLIILHDGEKIIYANSAVERNLGYSKKEVIGKKIYEFIHPDSIRVVEERIRKLKMGEDVSATEEKFLTKNGSYRIYEVKSKSVEIQGKKLILTVGRDITERKLYESKLEKLNRILRTINAINDLIVRASDEEKLLRDLIDILSRVYKDVRVWIFENDRYFKHFSANGNTDVESERIFPIIKNGKIFGFLSIDGDFEDDEAEIIRTLAKNIGCAISSLRNKRALKIAIEKIEENIEKIAVLIDKIRNPLTAIQGFAETICGDCEHKEKILKQVKRIEEFLNDLDRGWMESKSVREVLRKYDF